MEHRYIGLIVCACIIFVAVILITIRYLTRHKHSPKIKDKMQQNIDKMKQLNEQIQKEEEQKFNE